MLSISNLHVSIDDKLIPKELALGVPADKGPVLMDGGSADVCYARLEGDAR